MTVTATEHAAPRPAISDRRRRVCAPPTDGDSRSRGIPRAVALRNRHREPPV